MPGPFCSTPCWTHRPIKRKADRFIGVNAVRGTAACYGVLPNLVPRLAHALMLEPRREDAAQPLRAWLERLTNVDRTPRP